MDFGSGLPLALHRKVTIWPRVQLALGAKLVALTPEVTLFATAQATESA